MNHAARRNKGSRGERELAALLNERFDLGAKRSLGQAREGGEDINLNDLGIVIEVKRQEALQVNAWWRQVCEAANNAKCLPVLAYRQNRRKWKFVLPSSLLVETSDGQIEVGETVFFDFLDAWINAKSIDNSKPYPYTETSSSIKHNEATHGP